MKHKCLNLLVLVACGISILPALCSVTGHIISPNVTYTMKYMVPQTLPHQPFSCMAGLILSEFANRFALHGNLCLCYLRPLGTVIHTPLQKSEKVMFNDMGPPAVCLQCMWRCAGIIGMPLMGVMMYPRATLLTN
jgi:hypothetical protein